LHTPLLVYLQERLADGGYRNVRFNFPYKEQGRRLPDRAPVLERCFRSVIAALRADLGFTEVVIGGVDGDRMARIWRRRATTSPA
jgi:predicted alpha/beta-hydrolase family hydrolase